MPALSLSLLDQAIIATALPPIAGTLRNFAQSSWVITTCPVASTAITLIAGRSRDLYGRRPALVASFAVFIVSPRHK